VRRARDSGAQLVLLPEMFNCPYDNASFPKFCEEVPLPSQEPHPERHPTSAFARAIAKECGVYLVAGSFPEVDGERLYNTCLVVDPQGRVLAKHRKAHLFDINIPGGIQFKESDTLSPGNAVTVVDTALGKLGVGICYDMRFAEYAQACVAAGATVLCYPGAFNTVTGPAHWELLQRARAVDNQVFVLTCSPARNPDSKYQAWGYSSAISPWGEVLATTEHDEALVLATLDMGRVDETRQRIPIHAQKRYDLYARPGALVAANP
jgi:omega-amidase